MSHIKAVTLAAERLLDNLAELGEPQSAAEKSYKDRLDAALAELAKAGKKPAPAKKKKTTAGRKPAEASERG